MGKKTKLQSDLNGSHTGKRNLNHRDTEKRFIFRAGTEDTEMDVIMFFRVHKRLLWLLIATILSYYGLH